MDINYPLVSYALIMGSRVDCRTKLSVASICTISKLANCMNPCRILWTSRWKVLSDKPLHFLFNAASSYVCLTFSILTVQKWLKQFYLVTFYALQCLNPLYSKKHNESRKCWFCLWPNVYVQYISFAFRMKAWTSFLTTSALTLKGHYAVVKIMFRQNMLVIVLMRSMTQMCFIINPNLLLSPDWPVFVSYKYEWGTEVWLIAPCWFNQQGVFSDSASLNTSANADKHCRVKGQFSSEYV